MIDNSQQQNILEAAGAALELNLKTHCVDLASERVGGVSPDQLGRSPINGDRNGACPAVIVVAVAVVAAYTLRMRAAASRAATNPVTSAAQGTVPLSTPPPPPRADTPT